MFIRIFVLILVVYLSLGLILFFLQTKLLFPRDERPFGNCADMKKWGAIPQTSGSLRFYQRKLEQSFGSVIYFHGNAGNACDRAYFLQALYELPYDFYFFEYPGYGGDPSTPSEKKILEASLEFMDLIIANKNPRHPISLFGESLGSGVATYVASQRPKQTAGLILQAPYTSMKKVARSQYPYFPTSLLLRHPFPAEIWAREIPSNLEALILMASEDKTIFPEISRAQAENFQRPPRIIEFTGAGHNTMIDLDSDLYFDSIANYLEESLMNAERRVE